MPNRTSRANAPAQTRAVRGGLPFGLPMALLAISPLAGAQTRPLYDIVDLGVLPGHTLAEATAINNAGQIVGICSDIPNARHTPFVWENGVMRAIVPVNPFEAVYARDINNLGQVALEFHLNSARHTLSTGVTEPTDTLAGHHVVATCINDHGWIGGKSWIGGDMRLSVWHGFDDLARAGDNDANATLYSMNGAGFAVGYMWDASLTNFNYQACVWSDRESAPGFLPRITGAVPSYSRALSVNDDRIIVGYGPTPLSSVRALQWTTSSVRDLDDRPPQWTSLANAINNHGEIVGQGNGHAHPHWDAAVFTGGRHRWLDELLPAGHGWDLLNATDINDLGWIVGVGLNPALSANNRAYLLIPRCLADYNLDGFVTGDDFDAFVDDFVNGSLDADFNGDGFVTGDDFDGFVTAFGAGC